MTITEITDVPILTIAHIVKIASIITILASEIMVTPATIAIKVIIGTMRKIVNMVTTVTTSTDVPFLFFPTIDTDYPIG